MIIPCGNVVLIPIQSNNKNAQLFSDNQSVPIMNFTWFFYPYDYVIWLYDAGALSSSEEPSSIYCPAN